MSGAEEKETLGENHQGGVAEHQRSQGRPAQKTSLNDSKMVDIA